MNKQTFANRLRSLEDQMSTKAKAPTYFVITTRLLERYPLGSVELALLLAKKGALGMPFIVLPAKEDSVESWNDETDRLHEDYTAYNRPNN